MELDIFDSLKSSYTLDVVNCYKKSTAIIMNYIKEKYGNLYLVLDAFNDLYTVSNYFDSIPFVVNRIFNLKIIHSKERINIFAEITHNLEAGFPVLLGIDLYEIFYSAENYKKTHWPHWIIIIGYDLTNETISILDDTHLELSGGQKEYKKFYLPFDLVTKAHSSFVKNFPESKDLIIYKFSDNKKSEKDILMGILSLYLDSVLCNCDDTFYKIYTVLKDKKQHESNLFYREMYNNNKRRIVLEKELTFYLRQYKYEESDLQNWRSALQTCYNKWNTYIMRSLINLQKGNGTHNIGQDIKKAENDFVEETRKLLEYLSTYESADLQNQRLPKHKHTINDKDGIVSVKKEKIIFNFNTGKLYNWWLTDCSPKQILFKGNRQGHSIVVSASYKIISDYKENCFQLGIYISDIGIDRNRKETFFSGIDQNGMFVLDHIGKTNTNCFYTKELEGTLYIYVSEDIISAGVMNNTLPVKLLERLYMFSDDIEIGLACKTWGNGKKLEVHFWNCSVRFCED